MASARLEEALYTLQQQQQQQKHSLPYYTPHASKPLAPELQSNILASLSDLKADAVLDYLSQPLELAEVGLRRQALTALRSLFSLKKKKTSMSATTTTTITPQISIEYAASALPVLTSEEICTVVVDWEKILSALSEQQEASPVSWLPLTPDAEVQKSGQLLSKVGLAHIVYGFSARKPEYIATALHILRASKNLCPSSDVAIHAAVCEVLLGSPTTALDILREDEHHGMALGGRSGRGNDRGHPFIPARSRFSAAAAAASLAFPERDGVMTFIRAASPEGVEEGETDLLPGLCLFVEQWLQRFAFPQIRDSAQHPPLGSLSAYFDDPHTEAYLESRDRGGGYSRLLGSGVGVAAVAAVQRGIREGAGAYSRVVGAVLAAATASVGGTQGSAKQYYSGVKVVTYVAGVAAVLATMFSASVAIRRSHIGGSGSGLLDRSALSSVHSMQSTASTTTKQQQQTKNKKQATSALPLPSVSTQLTKDTALGVVKEWLAVKAEAMGPRHLTARLPSVLTDPMLSAVAHEAREAASSGWFWNIRPLRARIVSMDASQLSPEGVGCVTIVAAVDESADLWATNGKKGDSYKTEYRVEYSMVRAKGGWKIASALVLGK